MFRKVHIRLTLLCAGITAVIMIIMSLCYLYVSETGLYRNQFQSFQNDINTITTNLEQQSVISMEWLSKMEAQGNYLFYVLDGGVPFLYNQLNDTPENSSRSLLLDECRNAYERIIEVDASSERNSSYASFHSEFRFVSQSTDVEYFGSVINMGQNASSLEIIVLSSLQTLEKQILEQRFHFILIDLAAILALTVFSWLFTGLLLKPIMENHQKQEGFLKTIHQEGLRMSSLVNDMLTLSGSDNQRFAVRPKPIELDTLLMNSYEAFDPLARDKSITLSISLPDKALPPCSADPERISQVISILLHNAISYTPEHGRIALSLSYKKEHFYLSVKDNGIGISDEDKKKIFDRFYRVEKARSTKEHFGLGLSIAYEIVKAHGGSIQVTDAEGGGSIFTVIL